MAVSSKPPLETTRSAAEQKASSLDEPERSKWALSAADTPGSGSSRPMNSAEAQRVHRHRV
eukprot:4589782-Pleurochrysis_carterae.AAC.2